jgi:hypothetical protein
VESTVKKTEFRSKFDAWLRHIGAPKDLDLDPLDKDYRTLEWTSKGKSYAASQNASGDGGFFVKIEWHKKKTKAE